MTFIDFLKEEQITVDTQDPKAVQHLRKAKRAAETDSQSDDKMVWRDQIKKLQAQMQGATGRDLQALRTRIQQLKDKIAGRAPRGEQIQECEVVYTDVSGEILTEAAVRQFKRIGTEIKKRYRCLSGPKSGKLVTEPGKCAQRKDPRKVRQGRKLMRSKKGTIKRKSALTKRKSVSRLVSKMNKRLSGK